MVLSVRWMEVEQWARLSETWVPLELQKLVGWCAMMWYQGSKVKWVACTRCGAGTA